MSEILDPGYGELIIRKPAPEEAVVSAYAHSGVEVVRIQGDGRLFWRGREVHTDDHFRAAILELLQIMTGQARGAS